MNSTENQTLIWYEDDPFQYATPKALASVSNENRKILRDAGIDNFKDITNIRILWLTRDVVMHKDELKLVRVNNFHELPKNVSIYEFLGKPVFRQRQTFINSWGPMVSRSLCLMGTKYCLHVPPLRFIETRTKW